MGLEDVHFTRFFKFYTFALSTLWILALQLLKPQFSKELENISSIELPHLSDDVKKKKKIKENNSLTI